MSEETSLDSMSDDVLASRLAEINVARDKLAEEARAVSRVRLRRTVNARMKAQVSNLSPDDPIRKSVEEALKLGQPS